MNVSDFDFHLPPERIAQTPAERRDESRLLVLDRAQNTRTHRHFCDLPEFLRPGDLLILNDTKVIPARLHGQRESGGRVELLLLEEVAPDTWKALSRPARKVRVGDRLSFGPLAATVLEAGAEGERLVRLESALPVREALERVGEMPLPPYITEKPRDAGRYQTVYAREEGSAAAPTAGLHFTPQLFERLKAKGVGIDFLTLHVGLGTFRPVAVETVEDHRMHSERFTLSAATAQRIKETKARGGRVVAVGTTVTRTLEHCGREGIRGQNGQTDIFITPGFPFQVVDALITNFHLPRSTLIMLVSAFVEMKHPGQGREIVLAAYQEAIEREYRFFSFGDAMILV